MGVDLERLLERTHEMMEACRLPDGNPGLDLGLRLGAGATDGRDKVLINPTPGGFGLWVEQLIAESTGKEGKGLVPAPGETPTGRTARSEDVRVTDPYELGQEFFRWEFATAVAGSLIGINPFDQPDVQAAKDRTNAILDSGDEPERRARGLGRRADRAGASRATTSACRRSSSRREDAERRIEAMREHVRAAGMRHDRRLRAALPALDRPAAQGRAAERALPPDRGRARGACRSRAEPSDSGG